MTDSMHPAIAAGEIRIIVDGARGVTEQDLSAAIVAQARAIADLDWRVERLFPDSADNALLLRGPITGALDAVEVEAVALHLRRELSARADVDQAAVDLPVDAYLPPGEIGALGLADLPPETEDPAWAHRLLHVPEAWALSAAAGRPGRGAGIVVAHPDTGYTLHPRLGPDRLDLDVDRDFIDNDDDAEDPLDRGLLRNPGHGTATGSVIVGPAAVAAPGLGVAPEARLLPLRAIRGVTQIFDSDVARAVDWARSRNAHVVSMSLGGKGFFGLERAIQRAVDAGIIVLAAAGNFVGFVTAPASYANTIAVAGSDFADRPWEGSSRGQRVDVSAPAEAVHVAAFDFAATGDERFVVIRNFGTSFAVTHVAGLAALWLAHHGRTELLGRYGASQLVAVFRTLLAGAAVRRPPGWDEDNFGSGVVDAQALLEAELPAAGAVIASAAFAEPDDAAQRIAALLGDVAAPVVVERIAALSGVTPQAARAWLAHNEDEIAYLLLTQPQLRDVMTAQVGASAARRPELPQATDAVRAVLGAPPAPADPVATTG
jgi:subtilisin family serine protease